MKTVYSPGHFGHEPRFELSDGKFVPAVEIPARAEIVLKAVAEARLGEIVAPGPADRTVLARVHDPDYLDFLEGFWAEWKAKGRDWDALPLAWAVPGLRRVKPRDIDGRLSYYSFDAGTPLTGGTFEAALSSASVAATGAAIVSAGAASAFALCRPPGHHAAGDFYGGYCFINNAAVAAETLLAGGAKRVAILDVDYHHGNGTQAIFYRRADVFFASLHADPRDEYPFFLGHADETGEAAGEGANANYPLALGTDLPAYLVALDDALARMAAFRPDAVVVSLGMDTYEHDPISKFRLRTEDYPVIGARIAALGRPTLFVMEGGYAVDALGNNVVAVLSGFGND
ncbi:MAG: histone deacetylase family protein [Hyphomicrobiales bacterium]